MRRISSLVRGEPLVQFALVAAGLFALYGAVAPPDSEAIRVSPELVEDLVAEREQVLGRPLAEVERDEIIAAFIDEEVMVREALARGLVQRDGKMRHRLVNKMHFLLDEEPLEPTDRQLEAFYQEHRERYSTPPSISFEQAFFENPPEDPERVLEALAAGTPPESMSDRFWLGGSFSEITEAELVYGFGSDLADELMALPVEEWQGPLTSGRGTHFVRVTAHHPRRESSRQSVDRLLREDWIEDWSRQIRQRRVDELRLSYRVIVEERETG